MVAAAEPLVLWISFDGESCRHRTTSWTGDFTKFIRMKIQAETASDTGCIGGHQATALDWGSSKFIRMKFRAETASDAG